MIHRFRKITDGLYRGSAPSPKEVQDLQNQFGIKKIVSLDKTTGDMIDRTCQLLGIEHVMAPLDHTKQSLLNLAKLNIKKLLMDNGPTFIHCKEGKDRSGFLSALFKCKYLGENAEDAIKEAKSLGFGVGVNGGFIPMIKLYEKIIRECKSSKDVNSADIVSNTREDISDNRTGVLDEATRVSFAPPVGTTRQYPYDNVYNELSDQSPTRNNFDLNEIGDEEKVEVPAVGQYNNAAGVMGSGFAYPTGGFISD